MLIDASVRPRNLKRGVSMKKFCQALGFESEVGLTQLVGRIELSGEDPREFAFLCAMWNALYPLNNKPTKIIVEIDGNAVIAYCHNKLPQASANPEAEVV